MAEETYVPDNFVAGDTQLVSDTVTVLAGQVLEAGSIVGLVTATQKVILCIETANDGSEVPFGMIFEAVDATEGDVNGVAARVKGELNERAVVIDASWTLTTIYPELRKQGLFLKSTVAR